MKTFHTFLLFCFISTTIYCQEIPKVNIGIGYPFFNQNENYSYSGGEVYLKRERINLFIETPALISFKRNPDFYISPGISFLSIREIEGSGALGGNGGKDYKRSALSIYTKFLYQPEIPFLNHQNWNFGLITGRYLFTRSKGHHEWWYYGGENQYYGYEIIDTDSKAFFKSFYFGFITCFQVNFEKAKTIKPAIEFSFYPDFVNIYDSYSGDSGKNISHNLFMGSIIIGFGSKKINP